jgi:hypothetical protein
MPAKLVITLTTEQALVARFAGGRLDAVTAFPNDEAGYSEFSEFLAGCRPDPVHILADVVEEDYRFDLLPHTGLGSDRAELVGRKLRQMYRTSPYCAGWLQGRDTARRRDDRFLFTALTNPDVAVNWLNMVAARKLPLAGLYLLPMVLHGALPKLGLKQQNLLLVTPHEIGVRLSFFRDQKLRISQLTARVGTVDGKGVAKALSEEVANTRLYLHALRIMTLDEPMHVAILDPEGSLATLPDTLRTEAQNVTAQTIGRSEILAATGVPAAMFDASPMALYLHLLGGFDPPGNLAPRSLTEGYRHYVARRGLLAVAAAAAVVGIAWSAINIFRWYDLTQQTFIAASRTRSTLQEYADITRQFPASPTSAENLKLANDVVERFLQQRRSPEFALNIIGAALDAHPLVILRSIGWRNASQEMGGADGAREQPRPDAPPATGGTAAGAAPQRRQSALIDAEIRPFSGDFRGAIEEINNLADRLRRSEAVAEVRVISLPLNVNPSSALSGSTLDAASDTTVAPFKLLVVLKQAT